MSDALTLTGLDIAYARGHETAHAVRSVDLAIAPGETVAVVGESGSGKSSIAKAIMGLLPVGARASGSIVVRGERFDAGSSALARLRGRVIGLVPQDPSASLNPTMRIGRQVGEVLVKARGRRYPALDADVIELLEQVGLDQPAVKARQYPHELSGGMRQRVLIAIAMAGDPALIIADEPTSALDVTVQRKVLDHLDMVVRKRNTALLLITHDLGVAFDRAHRIVFMHDGRIVESGPSRKILAHPAHDYTRSLIAAAPACAGTGNPAIRHRHVAEAPEFFRLEGVSKQFRLPYAIDDTRLHTALHDVTISARRGQTLAIVGESGSGKTTALRIALGLEPATSGRVIFEGREIGTLGWNALRPLRRRIQLVQQNPFTALDPRFTVRQSVVEPLVSFGERDRGVLDAAARRLLTLVCLPVTLLERLPRQLSGGQQQRVAIARALALEPDLLFLDEPVSALDAVTQRQILDLLGTLQAELGVSYVMVSHDLAAVASIAHHVAVLRRGRVVEQGTIAQIFGAPESDYTRALLDAIPGRRRAVAA